MNKNSSKSNISGTEDEYDMKFKDDDNLESKMLVNPSAPRI